MTMVASGLLTKKVWMAVMMIAAAFAANARAIQVVDEEGRPVASFECMVNTSDQGCSRWTAGSAGTATVMTFPEAKVIDLLVRAEGYASTIERFAGDRLAAFSDPNTKVVLKRGMRVELRLDTADGVDLPDDLKPEVYFADIEWRASIMRQPANRDRYAKGAPELDFNMLVKPVGTGKFELQLADDTRPFFVAIHHDGFLRFFEVGPFTMADVKDKILTVKVPKPARLDLKFDASAAKDDALPKGIRFDVLQKRPGGSGGYLQVAQEKRDSVKDASLSIADLVPGEYRYTVVTDLDRASQPIRIGEVHPGPFHDVGFVTLGDGETKVVDVKFVPLDMDVTRGDRTAIVHILKPNKEPAAGKKANVAYIDEHYGPIVVFNGEVPDNGTITLEKIAPGKRNALGYSGYSVQVGDESLGRFDFAEDEKQKEISFRLPVGVGDEAPDLELIDVSTGKHTRLSSFRGKTVWLEFWATWCGPCQPAMAELVKSYGEHRDEWVDNVAVVPVSVDDTSEVVVQHTKDRGWDVFPHFWSERLEDRTSFGSSAASQFGVNGVPTAFLIGTDGKIRWTGHPAGATQKDKSLAEFIKSNSTD
jgi:thiol-disulfide isomerase/thioredoxin